MAKTELVGARVEPWVKEIIKNKDMTIRDALEYMAKMLANPDELTWEHIKKIRGDIRKLELEWDTLSLRVDEITEQIRLKQNKIHELEGLLSVNPEDMAVEKVKPAVDAILSASARLGCDPLKVNQFAGKDLYSYQAMRVGVSKAALVEMVRVELDKQKGGDV